MASIIGFFNRLLPFATPGTPLVQDLAHLLVICVALYFAPQIQERLQQRGHTNSSEGFSEGEGVRSEEVDQTNNADGNNEAGDPDQQMLEEDVNPQGPERPDDDQNFPHQQNDGAENEAGPANAPGIPAQRTVGAKKAKSLARRDQKRAYHEFQRAQGDRQRALEAEGAAEREAVQAAERERRNAAEAKLNAKKAKEREQKREQERRQREEEISRREVAVGMVRRELEENRRSNLFDVARQVGGEDTDDVWVERMLSASGLLGRGSDGSFTMVTSTGWVVRVQSDDMARLYKQAAENGLEDENGKIGYDEISTLLGTIIQKAR